MTPKNRAMLRRIREQDRERREMRAMSAVFSATTVRELTRAYLRLWKRHMMYFGPVTDRMDRKGLERVARMMLEDT